MASDSFFIYISPNHAGGKTENYLWLRLTKPLLLELLRQPSKDDFSSCFLVKELESIFGACVAGEGVRRNPFESRYDLHSTTQISFIAAL